MYRVFIVLLLIIGFMGCGNKNESTENTETHAHQEESRSMIPEKVESPEAVTDVTIKPYFDEQGTVTEISVAPGETFTLWVIADYPEPYHMSAAEFSVKLPDGIEVNKSENFLKTALVMGAYDEDLMIAFGCQPPSKFFIVKYVCAAVEGFTGGEIKIAPGINVLNKSFLGFASCEPHLEEIPATGGTVTLKRK